METTFKNRVEAALTTLYATGSKAAAIGSFVFPSSMSFASSSGSFISLAPRTSLPYRSTDPVENSAVMAVLSWITRNFGQAEFQVAKQKRSGTREPISNHPLQQLLERPNAFYTGQALWAATELSYQLDGNAYWFKERNARGFGIPTALWYLPHWSIKPHWPEDGSAFIDYYERKINGRIEKIPIENIVHFRNGLNPANTRFGLAPLKAGLLNIFSDIEVDLWVAALCYNQAVPGTLIAPKGIGASLSKEKASQIKQSWKQKFGGDNRGEVGILDFEAEITQLGFDPSEMDFSAIHMHAETRISGLLGVPAIVAGLTAGLESSTYNNLDQLKKSAFEERLVPDWEAFEDEIDRQLLIDFEQDATGKGIFCEFDTSRVRALKEDQNDKEQRARDNLKSGGILIDEFRSDCGLPPLPNGAGQILLVPNNARPATPQNVAARAAETITDPKPAAPPTQPASGDKDKSAPQVIIVRAEAEPIIAARKAPGESKGFEWEGLTLRREPTELEKLVVKSIDDAQEQGADTLEAALLSIRTRMIDDAIASLPETTEAELHLLTVQPTEQEHTDILALLLVLALKGAGLIVAELNQQGAALTGLASKNPGKDELPLLASVVLSRVANDVQTRVAAAAQQALMLGLDPIEHARVSLLAGSTAYVSRAAAEGANVALAKGRMAEMAARNGVFSFLVYSAVLDANTCQPCGAVDGQTGQVGELPSVPNVSCPGGAQCRCVHIPVFERESV